MIIGRETLLTESFLLRIENSLELLHCFSSWLLESSRSNLFCSCIFVLCLRSLSDFLKWLWRILSWAWHIEFQTLSVEDLIIVESWRSVIKTDVLSWEDFIVRCSTFSSPLGSSILKVILAFFICSFYIFVCFHEWTVQFRFVQRHILLLFRI